MRETPPPGLDRGMRAFTRCGESRNDSLGPPAKKTADHAKRTEGLQYCNLRKALEISRQPDRRPQQRPW
jgi:hypothetical protein